MKPYVRTYLNLRERIIRLHDELLFQLDMEPSEERRKTLSRRLDIVDTITVRHFGSVMCPD